MTSRAWCGVLLLLLPAAALSTPTAVAGSAPSARVLTEVTAMTFNVKNHQTTGARAWQERRPFVVDQITDLGAGVVGVQEARGKEQRANLIADLADAGYGVVDTGAAGVRAPMLVFYRSDTFTVTEQGRHVFTVPAAEQDAECAGTKPGRDGNAEGRSLTWAVLQENGGEDSLFVANTHFAAGSACWESKESAARQVQDVMTAHNTAPHPIVLMGDLNTAHDASHDALKILGEGAGAPGSNHSWNLDPTSPLSDGAATVNKGWNGTRKDDDARLDYIFTNKANAESGYTIHVRYPMETEGGKSFSPSDHYAVSSAIGLG